MVAFQIALWNVAVRSAPVALRIAIALAIVRAFVVAVHAFKAWIALANGRPS